MIAERESLEGARAPWFERWFNSPHYHRLYAHRDESEAVRFVERLVRHLRPEPGASMLDLGCGAGRHARSLASKGFRVTGLDLAPASIEEARKHAGPHLRFHEHDMRIPFGERKYDYVFNFFTSFGYFEGLGEHLVVVRNIADSLKPGGRLLLDYLNVGTAETRGAPREVKAIDGVRYHLTRWADSSHIFKRIVVDDGTSPPVEHVERVAKLGLSDFELLFALNEIRIEEVYGDYELNPYDPAASPRLILLGRKEPRADVLLRRAS